MGPGARAAVRGITGLLVESPLAYVLKIVWVVMFVLSLDCLRGVLTDPSVPATGLQDNSQAFQVAASKEGLLVLALNMAAMVAISVIHALSFEISKIAKDKEFLEKQAR